MRIVMHGLIVGREYDTVYPLVLRNPQHLHARLKIFGSVVYSGQNMGMNIYIRFHFIFCPFIS